MQLVPKILFTLDDTFGMKWFQFLFNASKNSHEYYYFGGLDFRLVKISESVL